MEVLVGPTFTIENPSSPTTDRRLFLNGINEVDQVPSTAFRRISDARGSSESSSSIGTPDDSDNDDEEVESDFNSKTTNAFSSLEDSLPIKKGLSSHFDGKSKSFTDLSKVNSLNELNKQESPFNKRRRVLIASKFSRITRSSFYSWSNPQSMPLLPLDEEDLDNNNYYEQDQEYKARKLPYASSSSSSSSLSEDKKQEAAFPQSYAAEMRLRLGSFNSRSFSLADLKEHDDDDDDEDNDHED